MGGFDAEGLPPEIPLVLRLETTIDTTIGLAPVLTLEVPVDRPAMLLPGNRPPPYPAEARHLRAEAYVLLTFIVDIDGSVREETIRSLPAGQPMSPELSRVFGAFERAARQSARKYEYRPAEFMGCRVQMWVQQPFAFHLHR